MPRPIVARIHREALAHNLARARAAAPGARVWAVVKANAYGHGIARVFDALKGADGFAPLDFAEAEQLRALGWRGPMLMLEGAFAARDLEECSRLQLRHTVHRAEQIDWMAAHKAERPQHVYLKLNSGMNRLGFTPARYRAAYARLAALVQVEGITHMTHFADADAPQPGALDAPLTAFESAVRDLPGERSLCNSAATLRHGDRPPVRGDWIRPGILLYGSSPDHPHHTAADWDLRPAMTLEAQLIAVQDLVPGDAVGYGSAWRADRPTRVGIVACGYADGYPRVAPTGTPVLVDGVRTCTLGRVSMDMIAVDLGPVPHAAIGSVATLWGVARDGAVLCIDDVAHAAGTLGYELMCALAPRVPVEVV
ncbi:MAG TPA: alanine racemase [Caldimonas sp.]|nr:alanine racemase [Caldimonas sp.]